jgi:hypothetical protein
MTFSIAGKKTAAFLLLSSQGSGDTVAATDLSLLPVSYTKGDRLYTSTSCRT